MSIMDYGNDTKIKSRYKILFIIFVVLGVYYPSIFSGFNSIDDSHIISYLEDTNSTFLEILLPGKSHYYRPVIWLTYFFDKYVWGLEASFMHLENILLHAVNAVIVYLIADKVAGDDLKRLQLPLLSALLFSVHPINTEAVCWVAGRTDPLAALFILAAAYLLEGNGWISNRSRLLIPASCIFLGCLVKEVAFFFFPLAYLGTLRINYNEQGRLFILRDIFRNALFFILFTLLYLYVRKIGLTVEDKSVSILLHSKSSLIETAFAALTAFGYYVKKLFLPLPLNFAIVSYSKHYVWLGIAASISLCWLLWQRQRYFYYLGCSLFLISPAVLVAVRPIAWTPIAERYLYAPSAFFSIAVIGILFPFFSGRQRVQLLPIILIPLIILCAYLTVQRNLIWQDNFLLYKDAVAQSPEFARIRNEYGVALAERGQNKEANVQFETGKSIDRNYYLPILNMANVKLRAGKHQEALKILTKSYKNKKSANTEILKMQARVYENLIFTSKNQAENKKVVVQLIDTYQYIYLSNKDPYMAYRSAQLLLSSGEPGKAALLFDRASKEAPSDAFYKEPARKLAEKLVKK